MKTILLTAIIALLPGVAPAQEARYNPAAQSLQGTWISQLADASGNIQLFEIGTFHPDGSYSGANVNPSHTEHKGVWIRTGDRKFLLTVMFFTFDEKGVLNAIVKARIRITLGEDMRSYESVAERVVMDPAGKVLQVTPGIRGRSVLMDIEEPQSPE
ncbi:MAG: hypothetical protein U0R19_17720 [Bryobacteraceae bacterium]